MPILYPDLAIIHVESLEGRLAAIIPYVIH